MSANRPLPPAFFSRPADVVARDLLGRELERRLPGGRVRARIVETEAYLGPHDRASHAFGGRRTPRNESMYLPGGHAYVYRIYGVHYCLNVVTGAPGVGIAVLLRAAEIVEGEPLVRAARSLPEGPARIAAERLLSGPGNLCRGLAIAKELDGHFLADRPMRLLAGDPVPRARIVRGPRVGCESAGEAAIWPLRFAVAGSAAISPPRGRFEDDAEEGSGVSPSRSGYVPPAGASRRRPARRASASSSSSRSTGDRTRR